MRLLLLACSPSQPEPVTDVGSPPAVDSDGDGISAEFDCDDTDPSVFPGAPEVSADGVDQDCDDTDPCTDPRRWSPGDVDLHTDSDWVDFCADYDAVSGDLVLWHDAPAGLESCLCEVSGDMHLAAETGTGLRGVTAIGGDAMALYPHDLRSLQSAGALWVGGEHVALGRLQEVAGWMWVRGDGGTLDLPVLRSVGSQFWVSWTPGTTLPALESVETLDISGSTVTAPRLTHVDHVDLHSSTLDVQGLVTTDVLEITGSTVIAPDLESIGLLDVNHAFDTILPSVTTIGALLGRSECPSLPALESLESLEWSFDGALNHRVDTLWSALSQLTWVDEATFLGDVDLSQMPTGVSVQTLRLERTALTGSLTSTDLVAGHLIIEDNRDTTLSPLSSLAHVPGSLRILSCRSLTSLNLDGLETIGGGLLISRNGALPQAEIDALLDHVDVAGNVVVE